MKRLLSGIALLAALAAPAAAQDIFTVEPGETARIDRHSVCRMVKNTGTIGFMVPTMADAEWSSGTSAFLQNLSDMPGVSVKSCGYIDGSPSSVKFYLPAFASGPTDVYFNPLSLSTDGTFVTSSGYLVNSALHKNTGSGALVELDRYAGMGFDASLALTAYVVPTPDYRFNIVIKANSTEGLVELYEVIGNSNVFRKAFPANAAFKSTPAVIPMVDGYRVIIGEKHLLTINQSSPASSTLTTVTGVDTACGGYGAASLKPINGGQFICIGSKAKVEPYEAGDPVLPYYQRLSLSGSSLSVVETRDLSALVGEWKTGILVGGHAVSRDGKTLALSHVNSAGAHLISLVSLGDSGPIAKTSVKTEDNCHVWGGWFPHCTTNAAISPDGRSALVAISEDIDPAVGNEANRLIEFSKDDAGALTRVGHISYTAGRIWQPTAVLIADTGEFVVGFGNHTERPEKGMGIFYRP